MLAWYVRNMTHTEIHISGIDAYLVDEPVMPLSFPKFRKTYLKLNEELSGETTDKLMV